jgi:hypothetical protein
MSSHCPIDNLEQENDNKYNSCPIVPLSSWNASIIQEQHPYVCNTLSIWIGKQNFITFSLERQCDKTALSTHRPLK